MELSIKFTTRPSSGAGTRVLVLIIMVIAVLAARAHQYGPGTAFPAATLTAVLAAIQAASTAIRPRPASLSGDRA
jgi:hypothetical protein